MSPSTPERSPGLRASLLGPRALPTVWLPLVLLLAALTAPAAGLPWWTVAACLTVAGALSGDPVVRLVLGIAQDTEAQRASRRRLLRQGAPELAVEEDSAAPEPPLRGGLVIGVLERFAVTASMLAGFPNGVAVVVAIKGLARYGEFTGPAQREQFIIGSLASLLWASGATGLALLLRP